MQYSVTWKAGAKLPLLPMGENTEQITILSVAKFLDTKSTFSTMLIYVYSMKSLLSKLQCVFERALINR